MVQTGVFPFFPANHGHAFLQLRCFLGCPFLKASVLWLWLLRTREAGFWIFSTFLGFLWKLAAVGPARFIKCLWVAFGSVEPAFVGFGRGRDMF